jgi:hypothetical protein
MSNEELIDELTTETRYRGVLIVFVILGVLASAAACIVFSLGGLGEGAHLRDSSAFGVIAMPFGASMLLGSAIYKSLCFAGKRRSRRARK